MGENENSIIAGIDENLKEFRYDSKGWDFDDSEQFDDEEQAEGDSKCDTRRCVVEWGTY